MHDEEASPDGAVQRFDATGQERSAWGPGAPQQLRIGDEQGHHGPMTVERGGQRPVVTDPQVAPEPHDCGVGTGAAARRAHPSGASRSGSTCAMRASNQSISSAPVAPPPVPGT